MNSPSVDIKDMLASSAVGVGTFNTDLFIGEEPTGVKTQDAVVTIFDTGGFAPEAMVDIHYPTVMVRIRGTKNGYLAAYTKAESIKTALHKLTKETWNSTLYIQILAQSDILFNGYDEKDRPVFSINFGIQRS